MIFKPRLVARMWDTWLYHHGGTHYLFYLHRTRADGAWDGISVAVSDDGVHFADRGPILHKAADAAWLGTGMVWRVGERFMLNFSEERNGVQEIFFAESADLLRWRRLPDEEYVCRADPAWYADAPAFSSQRWDCIWVLPREDGDGYVGFLTAVAAEGPPGLCGTAGCVMSDDGRHFRPAPPAIETGFWGDRVEVGAVERIGDRFYMLLGVVEMPLGARHLARLPAGESGMFVLSAERQTGPYRLDPNQPMLLGSSPSWYTYFARFYRVDDELLLNHHTVPRPSPVPGDSYFSPLKAVHRDAAGVLSLRWWPGNEAIKGTPRPVALDACDFLGVTGGRGSATNGALRFSAPAGGWAILPVQHDPPRGVVLDANLTLASADGPLSGIGLFIEGPTPHPSPHSGAPGTLLLAQSDGRFVIGPSDGYGFTPEDGKPLPSPLGRTVRWRLLLRDAHLELYLDDELVQCYTLALPPRGRLGFVVEAGAATVDDVGVWAMSL